MSWFRALAVVLALASLAACGFRPLYGTRPGVETLAELSAIKIDHIKAGIGQDLRNHLLDRLTPNGEPDHPRYRLHVEVERDSAALAIQLDDTITRFNLTLTAVFSLSQFDTGTVLYRNNVRAVGSYNVVRSEFATLISEQDAARRAAREVSEEMRTLISVFFAHRRGGAS